MAAPDRSAKSLPTVAQELWEMVLDYFRQETIEPVRGLGRFLAFGVAGSIFLGTGLILLVLAGLRALQTEVDTFDGDWTWAPYGITAAGALLLVIWAASRIGRTGR